MSEQSNRPGTAKDWASDRRRAAGIVFDALAGLSVASKFFAVLLLAGKLTLLKSESTDTDKVNRPYYLGWSCQDRTHPSSKGALHKSF